MTKEASMDIGEEISGEMAKAFHGSLIELVSAAKRAAWKMKIEYDRRVPDADPDECWAECERLWHALRAFEVVDD